MLPTLSGTGRLTTDGELRYTASGTPVYSVNLAFSARKKDEAGNWVDGDKLFIRSVAFHNTAENLVESLGTGDEVTVTGRVKLNEWQDRESGEKRSRPELLIDTIGATIRRNTVAINRASRTTDAPPNDPWTAPAEEAPF